MRASLTTYISRANDFLIGTGLKITQERGWLKLEGFDPSKYKSNLIDAQNSYEEIEKGESPENLETIMGVLSDYPEHFSAHERFVDYCATREVEASPEMVEKLKDSKSFFEEEKYVLESGTKRIEENTPKGEDYWANVEECRNIDKVMDQIRKKRSSVESHLEKVTRLLEGKLSAQEERYEKIMSLMEKVKLDKDQEALLTLCNKEDRIRMMFQALKKEILNRFSHKISPEEIEIDTLSTFHTLLQGGALRRYKTLDSLLRFLFTSIYRRLEESYIRLYVSDLTPTDIRNINAKRKVERRLMEKFQTTEVKDEKIMKGLGWNRNKYTYVCECEKRLRGRADYDKMLETFGMEDEELHRMFGEDIGF
jgi:hypothetical protein